MQHSRCFHHQRPTHNHENRHNSAGNYQCESLNIGPGPDKDYKEAVEQALEIVSKPENKTKYSFLIYNTSVCVYEIIRPFLKENWQKNFVEIVEKIDKLFEEVEESDYNWRFRYTLLLFQALYDADKKPEAFKILEKLVNAVKNKGGCDFEDQLLRLRIHLGKENSGIAAGAKKV